MYTYKIHLHKEKEGGFTVSVPALPGCITYGEDVDEAIEMAKEAISLYIEELQDIWYNNQTLQAFVAYKRVVSLYQ